MRGIVVPVIVLNAGLEDSWGQENPCARTAFKGLSHQGRSGVPSVRADTRRKGSCAKAGFGPLGPHTEPEGTGPGGLLGPFPWLNEEMRGAVT